MSARALSSNSHSSPRLSLIPASPDTLPPGRAPGPPRPELRNPRGEPLAPADAERFRLLEAEAEAGDPAAAEELGLHLSLGTRLAPDPERARRLLARAARKGSVSAQANLGGMLLRGEGGPVDLGMARFWTRRAASAGSLTAREHLRLLESDLPPTTPVPAAGASPGPRALVTAAILVMILLAILGA